jgi:acetyl esterase/lipase
MHELADRDPQLTKPYLDRFARDYSGHHDPRLPLISPVFADYSGIESAMLLQCGSEEILLGDTLAVVKKARAAGVDVRLEIYERCYHGWQNAGDAIPEAADAASCNAAFVRRVCGDSAQDD